MTIRPPFTVLLLLLGGCQIVLGIDDPRRIDVDAGEDNANPALANLEVSRGQLDPPFDPAVTDYDVPLGLSAMDLIVTPTAEVPAGVTIDVAGSTVASGQPAPGVTLNLGETRIEITVTPQVGDARTYSITADRGAAVLQQAYLKASNTDPGDRLGFDLALDGDTLAVGATGEQSASTGVNDDQGNTATNPTGAVYVFVRDGTTWTQQAYVKASNTGPNDLFGTGVALSGDLLAVGAPDEDSNAVGVNGDQNNNSGGNSGAVYVFARSGTAWAQEAYIKASVNDLGDSFGESVALSGNTLVVGAPDEDSQATQGDELATDSGAVFVFERSGTTWMEQAYLKASDVAAGHRFGTHVSVDGDTLATGVPLHTSVATGSEAGAAYAFVRDGQNWSEQALLTADNAEAEDRFGDAVAISGDTLAVGAPREDSGAVGVGGDPNNNNAPEAGAVYVFVRTGTTWAQDAYVKAPNTDPQDAFGFSVDIAGDLLVVGAAGEAGGDAGVGANPGDNTAADAGAAYVLVRNGTTWTHELYLKASNPDAGDVFGVRVGVTGDTVAAGALDEASNATGTAAGTAEQADNSAASAGAAYVFQ